MVQNNNRKAKKHARAGTAEVARPILGRKQFAKISAVEGIVLTDDMKAAMAEFDRRNLPPEERRRAIIERFKRAGK